MTYKELVQLIEATAMEQPAVKTIVANDVYLLNTLQSAEYGVFAWSQNTHSGSMDSDETSFSFNLFYIDRICEDESNLVDIHSVAVEVLNNVIRTLSAEGVGVTTWSLQPFTEKFLDTCAGMYATIALTIPVNTTCDYRY
jgi:hypothetical protein